MWSSSFLVPRRFFSIMSRHRPRLSPDSTLSQPRSLKVSRIVGKRNPNPNPNPNHAVVSSPLSPSSSTSSPSSPSNPSSSSSSSPALPSSSIIQNLSSSPNPTLDSRLRRREQVISEPTQADLSPPSVFFSQPSHPRSLHVAVVGLPNAGKSSLMNALVGDTVSAVTHKRQSTRKKTVGVATTGNSQLVLFDTPGVVNPKLTYERRKQRKYQRPLYTTVYQCLSQADAVILVVDCGRSKNSLDEMWKDVSREITQIRKERHQAAAAAAAEGEDDRRKNNNDENDEADDEDEDEDDGEDQSDADNTADLIAAEKMLAEAMGLKPSPTAVSSSKSLPQTKESVSQQEQPSSSSSALSPSSPSTSSPPTLTNDLPVFLVVNKLDLIQQTSKRSLSTKGLCMINEKSTSITTFRPTMFHPLPPPGKEMEKASASRLVKDLEEKERKFFFDDEGDDEDDQFSEDDPEESEDLISSSPVASAPGGRTGRLHGVVLEYRDHLESIAGGGCRFDAAFGVSCRHPSYFLNVEQLRDFLLDNAQEGQEWSFAPNVKTELSLCDRIEETIREQFFRRLNQELPYRIHQQTMGITRLRNGDVRIDQYVFVPNQRYKRISVGKGGSTLRAVRERARIALAPLFENAKIHLFLYVKVRPRMEDEKIMENADEE